MADSKRVNTNIQRMSTQQQNQQQQQQQDGDADQGLGDLEMASQGQGHTQGEGEGQKERPDVPLSATIMSLLFWPAVGGWGDEQVSSMLKMNE